MTGIVICDPPSAARRTLAQRVDSVPQVEWVELVDHVRELPGVLLAVPPDIVLLSSRPIPAQVQTVVRMIRRTAPAARVLLLTMGTDPDEVVAGMAAGALGYLARDAATAEVAAALALLPEHAQTPPPAVRAPVQGGASRSDLTQRELQVLLGMSRGLSNTEIGEELFLSEDTIKTHARRLFRKLAVNDRAHAVAVGFRRGLLG